MTIAQIPFPNLMRPSAKRVSRLGEEIIVDLFAGGGGASTGIEHALGRDVDHAVNHDAEAIDMHTRNHPGTRHYRASVWEVKPAEVAQGRPVGLLWLSPDCKDFSRAKGGQPIRNKRIRALAWVACKWARDVMPRVIMLENVREFEEWGPLIQLERDGLPQFDPKTGKPLMVRDPQRKGETFRRFVGQLKRAGYEVQWKVLNASAFGAPTHRKRFFMIARSDGRAIVWPTPTHGPMEKPGAKEIKDHRADDRSPRRKIRRGNSSPELRMRPAGEGRGVQLDILGNGPSGPGVRVGAANGVAVRGGRQCHPFRTAAECIDWTIRCPSIFGRKKQLAPNTQRRIAMGLKRYVFDAASPFIVQVNHGGSEFRGQSINEPMPTVTQKHGFGIVAPVMTKNTPNEKPCQDVAEPLHTITTIHNKFQLAEATLVPFITRCAHGEGRWGHGTHSLQDPLPTQTASKDFALTGVTLIPFVAGVGGRAGQSPATPGDGPVGTITAKNDRAFVGASLVEIANSNWGDGSRSVDSPLATITATPKGGSWALAAVYLTKLRGSGGWKPINVPLDTIVATATTFCITTPILTILRNHADGQRVDQPTPTLTAAGQHIALACPYCVSYYGQGIGQPADVPLRTVTTKDRFGLAVPTLSDDPSKMGNAAEVYRFLMKYKDLIGDPANVTFHHNADGSGFVTLKVGTHEFLMTDLLLRMLTPRELLRAQFSPELAADYILPKSNAAAVHKIGNSVPPLVVSALVRANLPDLVVRRRRRSA